MQLAGIDIAHIVELGTHVAQNGALRAAEFVADDVYDYIIGVAVVIYESNPNS